MRLVNSQMTGRHFREGGGCDSDEFYSFHLICY